MSDTFAVNDIEMTSADLKCLSKTAQKSLDDANSEKETREIFYAKVPQRITSIIEMSKNFFRER